MKNLEELRALKAKTQKRMSVGGDGDADVRVLVGMATCGIAAGARPVFDTIKDEVAKSGLPRVAVSQTGCVGICQYEPVVEIYQGDQRVTYVKMTAEKAQRVVKEHLLGGQIVTEYTIGANA